MQTEIKLLGELANALTHLQDAVQHIISVSNECKLELDAGTRRHALIHYRWQPSSALLFLSMLNKFLLLINMKSCRRISGELQTSIDGRRL